MRQVKKEDKKMIIDGHAHALGEFSNVESIKTILDELKVDKIVLCPGSSEDPTITPIKPKIKGNFITKNARIVFVSNIFLRRYSKGMGDRDAGNQYVHSLVEKLPERIIQFYWVNFFREDYFEELREKFSKWKFKGLKLHQCVLPFSNDSEDMEKLSQFAAENNLPIFIHIFNPKEADKLVGLGRKHPKTNYIVAHMMGLENVISKGKDLKNFYFDISTYYIVSNQRIKKAIKFFGADHVLLGSDSPLGYDNLKNNIKKIKKMDIPKEQKELILGNGIAKLLDIQ